MRFGVKGKQRPRFIGPYEILERIGPVAHRLALPPSLGNVHNVFHVSQLRKYVHDPKYIIHQDEVKFNPELSYKNIPEAILNYKVQQLINKSITSVKILLNKCIFGLKIGIHTLTYQLSILENLYYIFCLK